MMQWENDHGTTKIDSAVQPWAKDGKRGQRTENELGATDALLDLLELFGVLVAELDVPDGILALFGTRGGAFDTLCTHDWAGDEDELGGS